MAAKGSAAYGAANALAAVGGSNVPRTCLRVVQGWLGIPPKLPTAAAAWVAATKKHPGDRNPPAGVPVFFAPNHVALSVGGGNIVTTDWPTMGHIGKTTISELSKTWAHPYLGWTGDLEGVTITGIGQAQTSVATVPVDQPTNTNDLSSLSNALGFLTDGSNWIRVAYLLSGIALCLFALWKSSGAVRSLTTATKKVAANAVKS